jgi:hypothetical protein
MNGDEVDRVAYFQFTNGSMSIDATLLLFLTATGRWLKSPCFKIPS